MTKKWILLGLLVFTGCTRVRVIQSQYVIQTQEDAPRCRYTWQAGDYWEFLAWALLDDVSAAPVLAVTSGYRPDSLPTPGTDVLLPFSEEFETATSNRMGAARLVRWATDHLEAERAASLDSLYKAHARDSLWSVPVTDISVILIEDGKTDEALELLSSVSHKSTPALILAGIAWRRGDTETALSYLAEALATSEPNPEALAASGIASLITGDRAKAGNYIRMLLENPNAPSDLRVLALRYALLLEENDTLPSTQ